MDWQSKLSKLAALAAPIEQARQVGLIQSAQAALSHPALRDVRDALLREVSDRKTITELLTASEALRQQHQQLIMKSRLSDDELKQLGVLSTLSLLLSSEALSMASSDEDRALFVVEKLAPFVGHAAHLGLLSGTSSEANQIVQTARTMAEFAGHTVQHERG